MSKIAHDSEATSIEITVTVVLDRLAPAMLVGAPVEACTLAEALKREWPVDAHIAAYEPRSGQNDEGQQSVMRLLHDAKKGRPAVYDSLDGLNVPNVRMVALIGDLDDPVAHANKTPARAEWRAEQLPMLKASGLAYYETRGGYRVLASIDFEITARSDARIWTKYYLGWRAYLQQAHGLVIDETCKDWTRLYRLPNVMRDGQPQRAKVIGTLPAFDFDRHWVEPKTAGKSSRTRSPDEATNGHATNGASRYTRFTPRVDYTCPADVKPEAHALTLAQTFPPAVQGSNGHGTLFDVCCHVVCGLQLDPAGARDLLWAVYNERCQPPWRDDERADFDHKIDDARTCKRKHGYLLPTTDNASKRKSLRAEMDPSWLL